MSVHDTICSVGTAAHDPGSGVNWDCALAWLCRRYAMPVLDSWAALPRLEPLMATFRICVKSVACRCEGEEEGKNHKVMHEQGATTAALEFTHSLHH